MAAESNGVLTLVPMKPLAEAKSRLSPGVDAATRQAAVLLMLHWVVRAAVDALGTGACRVIGGDLVVQKVAEGAGSDWQPEAGHDLNSSLWLAMQAAYGEGYRATLFLPSDLPMASAEDIRAVANASNGLTRPAGVAAQSDGGTNALLVPAACAFAPQLGLDSFALHTEAAMRQGTPLVQVNAPGLAFDVDTTEELAWARQHIAGFEADLNTWRTRLRQEHPNWEQAYDR